MFKVSQKDSIVLVYLFIAVKTGICLLSGSFLRTESGLICSRQSIFLRMIYFTKKTIRYHLASKNFILLLQRHLLAQRKAMQTSEQGVESVQS